MAKSSKKNAIVILILRIVTAILLALSIALMMTDTMNIEGGKITYRYIHTFRYLVVGSAIGIIYNFFQLGPAIYLILTRKSLLPYPFALYFDFLADQSIGYLLASSASAAFSVAFEFKRQYDLTDKGDKDLSKIDYYFQKAEISAALALIATPPMIVTSMLSAHFLFKS